MPIMHTHALTHMHTSSNMHSHAHTLVLLTYTLLNTHSVSSYRTCIQLHYLRMWQLSDNDIHVTGWLLNLVTQHSTSTHTIIHTHVATCIPPIQYTHYELNIVQVTIAIVQHH